MDGRAGQASAGRLPSQGCADMRAKDELVIMSVCLYSKKTAVRKIQNNKPENKKPKRLADHLGLVPKLFSFRSAYILPHPASVLLPSSRSLASQGWPGLGRDTNASAGQAATRMPRRLAGSCRVSVMFEIIFVSWCDVVLRY